MLESVPELLPAPVRVGSVGSLTPTGVTAFAVLTSGVAAPSATLPVTVKVTLELAGKVGITMPAPCIKATVVFAAVGQAAPPVGVPQVTLVTLRPATEGSLKTVLFAALGPAFETTIV